MIERWLPVVGYENYEVSDFGNVRSIDRVLVDRNGLKKKFIGKLLTPGKTGDRLTVSLHRRSHYVHVLVLMAFVGPAPLNTECCHDNGNGFDNRLCNLRWDTRRENMLDRVRHGTHHAILRELCPYRHQLVAPNLVACKDGRRCLACNRANGNMRYAVSKGRPFDFQYRSDEHYRLIMKDAA